MSDHDKSDQTGPAVWADEPQPVLPPMRTFKVILDPNTALCAFYIDAHSVTFEGDAAHFYVYRPTTTSEGAVLVAYALRTLRPYLDVEDITSQLAATGKAAN